MKAAPLFLCFPFFTRFDSFCHSLSLARAVFPRSRGVRLRAYLWLCLSLLLPKQTSFHGDCLLARVHMCVFCGGAEVYAWSTGRTLFDVSADTMDVFRFPFRFMR